MIEVKNLSTIRAGQELPILKDISFRFEDGECISIVGFNGSGKSTLALSLVGLIPEFYKGVVTGFCFINSANEGENLLSLPVTKRLSSCSYVFQDVESQILFGDVSDILGLNEIGDKTIIKRFIEILHVENLLHKKPNELSNGEAQKIALISAFRNMPKVVIYDEAIATLDYHSKKLFKEALRFVLDVGTTIILLGQNKLLLQEYSSRCLFINNGNLSADPPQNVKLDLTSLIDVHVNLAHNSFGGFQIKKLFHKYKNWEGELNVQNFEAKIGEVIAIVGDNGSGKSTFLNTICGFVNAQKEESNLSTKDKQKKIFNIFVSPTIHFCEPTIKDEIKRVYPDYLNNNSSKIQDIFTFLEFEKDPLELSYGQQKVLVCLLAFLSEKPIIMMDEPEIGMDFINIEFLKLILLSGQNSDNNKVILFSTHDLKLAKECATRIIMFKNGKIVKDVPNIDVNIEDWFENDIY